MEEQIQEQQIQEVQEEMDHRDECDTDLDTSVTRSGRARIPTEDVGCQTKIDYQSVPQPKVRLIFLRYPGPSKACYASVQIYITFISMIHLLLYLLNLLFLNLLFHNLLLVQ